MESGINLLAILKSNPSLNINPACGSPFRTFSLPFDKDFGFNFPPTKLPVSIGMMVKSV
jgi:hypothetical protein